MPSVRKVIPVRPNDDEYELIKKAAEMDKRSMSQYLVIAGIEQSKKAEKKTA